MARRDSCGQGNKPRVEVFDSGDIHLVKDMMAKGSLPFEPPLFQIVLGVNMVRVATSGNVT